MRRYTVFYTVRTSCEQRWEHHVWWLIRCLVVKFAGSEMDKQQAQQKRVEYGKCQPRFGKKTWTKLILNTIMIT